MRARAICRVALPAAIALCLTALPATGAPRDVAEVTTGVTQVQWTANHGYAGFRLVVSGPDGDVERSFDGGDSPLFSLADLSVASDGLYKWELTATPELPRSAIAALSTEAAAADRGIRNRGPATDVPTKMSGTFRVENGGIVQPAAAEQPAKLSPDRAGAGTGSATAPLTRATADDQVINDDLIVDGSACVGFDCVNGESFGFDTIRMKENNVRLHFDDTSNSASFPDNDWRIVANDTTNGGAEFLAFEDASASRKPFLVEAGARNNALYVESDGDIGIGTNNPVVDLHVVTGNTPTLRLEQDGSSGFTAQTWDLAGNETNFFIRDATNGSTLPFRIRPGAPTSAIDVAATGRVGMGTSAPSQALHVQRGLSAQARILVEDTAGDAILTLMELKNAGEARFSIEDTSAANRRWELRTTGDNFQFTRNGAPSADMLITQAGNMTIRGTLTTSGPTCSTPCDGVFAEDFALPSIEENAAEMWTNGFLPAVGPTIPKAPFNVVEKTGGILHELEKAHIYIEQLHQRNSALESEQQALRDELAQLRADVARILGQTP